MTEGGASRQGGIGAWRKRFFHAAMPLSRYAPHLALSIIAIITTAWWALALWPLPDAAPPWLEHARFVCFGVTRNSLPSAAGWLLLIGEPLAMTGLVVAIWPQAVALSLRALLRSTPARLAFAGTLLAITAGVTTAALRVRASHGESFDVNAGPPAERMDRAPWALELTDQRGGRVSLAEFRGRPVIVAFGYAHCATVCPVVVREALAAQREAPGAVLLVVTLDPWRDTPSRLPSLAVQWQLGADAYVLGGDTLEVQAALDRWEIPRTRDAATGDVTHATFVYLIDRAGRLRWRAPGDAAALRPLLRDL